MEKYWGRCIWWKWYLLTATNVALFVGRITRATRPMAATNTQPMVELVRWRMTFSRTPKDTESTIMLGPWCRFNEAIIIVITIVNAIAILMIVTYIVLFRDGFSLHLFWITVTRFFQKCLVGSLVRHEQVKPQQNTVAARSEVVAWHTADSRLILKAVIGHPSLKKRSS